MDRIKWDEQKVFDAVREVMDYLDIDRMPTHTEMRNYYGNNCLTDRIQKTGGSKVIASKLGLSMVQSETGLGEEFEEIAKELLENNGFKCNLTPLRFPYDILANGRVKIDVKVANKRKVGLSDAYAFRLAKSMQTCDIYMAFAINSKKEIQKLYIIPSNVVSGKVQLCMGTNQSKYDIYLDRWDLIRKYDEAIKQIAV